MTDQYIIDNYGAKNLSKIRKKMSDGVVESKRRFTEKYPNADLSKFDYNADLDIDGNIVEYKVFYKVDDVISYNITSSAFLDNEEWMWYLYQWERIWDKHGTVQDFRFLSSTFPYEINKFDIYVTNSLFFTADFPKFSTSWNDDKNSGKDVAVNKLKFDYENNPYFASLLAMYLVTYSCGIGIGHLKSSPNTPKIVTSMARYHVYYHMSRFLRDPTKMTKYVSNGLLSKLSSSLIYSRELIDKFYQFSSGAPNINVWRNEQPNRNKIVNYRYARNSGGRIVGIYYQLTDGDTKNVYLRRDNDYLEYAASESNGLTRMGQLLFQQSMESYVYCVLGAQAETRWPIVGRGAMSLQSQEVFMKLVSDTIIQSDHTIAISNMRKAIKNTNVILNMAISPGMILIPSNMIIQTSMVSGYNNILTLAVRGDMKFGVNSAVNYLRDEGNNPKGTEAGSQGDSSQSVGLGQRGLRDSSQSKTTTTTPTTSSLKAPIKDTVSNNPKDAYKEYLYLFVTTTLGGVLISKYVI